MQKTDKSLDAFRTIGEVAEELDLPQHVLRFWETKFSQIKPLKRAGGRRYYRPDDVQLVVAIRALLYGEGYTIKGVQRILKEQGARALIAAARGAGGGRAGAPLVIEDASRSRPRPGALPSAARTPGVTPSPLLERLRFSLPGGGLSDDAARLPGDDGQSRFSAQDGRRLRAILTELDECARLLATARRK